MKKKKERKKRKGLEASLELTLYKTEQLLQHSYYNYIQNFLDQKSKENIMQA